MSSRFSELQRDPPRPQGNDPVSRLVFELSKLPGIGEKTATRLTYHILKQDESYARALSDALLAAKRNIVLCQGCFTFTDTSPCRICANPGRDHATICVVERPSDMLSIEQTGAYRGVYHVLHGALSPLDGIGPDDLKIRELLMRLEWVESGDSGMAEPRFRVLELILGTNPSVEGEATALYLARLIRPAGAEGGRSPIRITRLAHGIPVGGLLEYTDRQTIGKALENRVEMG